MRAQDAHIIYAYSKWSSDNTAHIIKYHLFTYCYNMCTGVSSVPIYR